MTISGSSLPTGEQYEISAGGFTAVVTEVGAGLRSLRKAGRRLVMEFPASDAPVGACGELLLPWPNRIRDGRYTFDGADEQLEITEEPRDNAIHGLTRHLPWTVAEHTPESVTLTIRLDGKPGYPHVLDLAATYTLHEDAGLTISVTAINAGSGAAPYGIGSHAYLFSEGGLDGDDAVLRLPADSWLPVDDRMLPTGVEPVAGTDYDFREGRALRDVVLDTAFTGLRRAADGKARVSLGHAEPVTMWIGEGLEWVQAFSGDPLAEPYRRSALAVEPMSCPADAYNSGDGLIRLEPGQSVTHTWGIVG